MILKLKGSTFAVTGTLTHFTRATAHEAIVRGGGTVTKSVTSKTRALIAGGSAGAKIDQARSRGALILDEEQFQKLLRDGEIEVVEDSDKPVEETISFRDAIAELRGALDGHPTSDKWTRIVYALDACDPALLGEAVAYVEGYIAQWDGRKMDKWVPFGEHDADDALEHYQKYMRERMSWGWLAGAPARELRLAPPHWTQEMVQGIDSPKFRTVRALNFSGMKVNTTMLNKMLGLSALQNVRFLNLGSGNKVSKTFFQKLRTTETMRGLEELWVDKLSEKDVEGFVGEAVFDDLHTLRFLSPSHKVSPALWRSLFTCASMQHIRTLSFNWNLPGGLLYLLSSDPSFLPSFEAFELRSDVATLRKVLQSDLVGRLKGLALLSRWHNAAMLDELFLHTHKLQGLKRLRLDSYYHTSVEHVSDVLVERAEEFQRFESLNTLDLGCYDTESVREALSVLDGVELIGTGG